MSDFNQLNSTSEASTHKRWYSALQIICQNTHQWMKRYVTQIKIILSLIGLLSTVLLVYSLSSGKQTQQLDAIYQHQTILTRELSDIDQQLQDLSETLQASETDQSTLAKIMAQLADIETHLQATIKKSDLQQLSQQLSNMKADVDSQFDHLEKNLAGTDNRQYIDAKALPFQVVAVDIIAQQPFVSIQYDHRIAPLNIEDSLAGWKLISADFDRQEATFVNENGQYAKLSVTSIATEENHA